MRTVNKHSEIYVSPKCEIRTLNPSASREDAVLWAKRFILEFDSACDEDCDVDELSGALEEIKSWEMEASRGGDDEALRLKLRQGHRDYNKYIRDVS